jgi:hypothetical protein
LLSVSEARHPEEMIQRTLETTVFFFGQLETIDVTGLGRNPETRHLAKKKSKFMCFDRENINPHTRKSKANAKDA